MAAVYRCVTAFSGANEGWTESFCFNKTSDSVGEVAGQLILLHQLRGNMLGREYKIDGYRVSKIRTGANVPVRRVPFLVEQVFRSADTSDRNQGDFDSIALIVRGANAAGDASCQHWLGGPPDSACDRGGEYNPDGNGIGGKFNSWRGELITQNGGWMAQPPTKDVQVLGYTQAVNQTVELTFPAATFTAPQFGTIVKIRCRGINRGSQLNRQLLVIPSSATTAVTVEQIAVQPFVSTGFAKIYGDLSTFISFAGLSVAKIGNHKRGRPLFTTPGRAKRQIRI